MPNLLNQIQNNTQSLTHKIGGAFNSFLGNEVSFKRPTSTPSYMVNGTKVNDTDLKTLQGTLFSEMSNRVPQKQALEANVITATALNRIPQYQNRGMNMSLSEVLQAPNQYQGYGSKEYQRFMSGATTTVDKQKIDAINQVIAQLKSGQFKDRTNGSVFYHHDPQGQIFTKSDPLFK